MPQATRPAAKSSDWTRILTRTSHADGIVPRWAGYMWQSHKQVYRHGEGFLSVFDQLGSAELTAQVEYHQAKNNEANFDIHFYLYDDIYASILLCFVSLISGLINFMSLSALIIRRFFVFNYTDHLSWECSQYIWFGGLLTCETAARSKLNQKVAL